MAMPYLPRQLIELSGLYTIYYFQFESGYVFHGESHDFWELVYIDYGMAQIGAGPQVHLMKQGDIILHQPNEFHTIYADQAVNIFVVTFACRSEAMDAFRGYRGRVDEAQRRIISRLIREAKATFGHVLDVPLDEGLRPTADAPAGGEQMVELLLTQLLLELSRAPEKPLPLLSGALLQGTGEKNPIEQTVGIMRDNLDGTLTIRRLCREIGMSQTLLQKLIHKYTGSSAMAFYQHLRIEESRRALRDGELNVTQIAMKLGYSSVQAFSRQFTRLLGVSPRAYQKMVRE